MLKANEVIDCTARISGYCEGSITITQKESKAASKTFNEGYKYITREWGFREFGGAMCPKCLEMASGLWMEICDAR